MLVEVKKCVDNNDIKGLHYIFVDCLDVDPTFKKYKEDFEYCRGVNGFLESHIELTPISRKEDWDNKYWEQLKGDLLKNFSEERFSHMREVALYVFSDKVKRLNEEREKDLTHSVVEESTQERIIEPEEKQSESFMSDADKEAILEEQKEIKRHNKLVEKRKKEQRERVATINDNPSQYSIREGSSTKKTTGIAIAALIVAIIIVIIVLIIVL